MNKSILMGRVVRDPEIRYTQGENPMAVARYSLAVNRQYKKKGDETTADFISCIAFGKSAEFVEKYIKKGMKLLITGRIQTGSYINKEGQKIYTTEIVIETQEFTESKSASNQDVENEGFMNIPDEELPFH